MVFDQSYLMFSECSFCAVGQMFQIKMFRNYFWPIQKIVQKFINVPKLAPTKKGPAK